MNKTAQLECSYSSLIPPFPAIFYATFCIINTENLAANGLRAGWGDGCTSRAFARLWERGKRVIMRKVSLSCAAFVLALGATFVPAQATVRAESGEKPAGAARVRVPLNLA